MSKYNIAEIDIGDYILVKGAALSGSCVKNTNEYLKVIGKRINNRDVIVLLEKGSNSPCVWYIDRSDFHDGVSEKYLGCGAWYVFDDHILDVRKESRGVEEERGGLNYL